MIYSIVIVAGFLIVIAIISGVLAAFVAHGYIWEKLPERLNKDSAGVLGGIFCALTVFGMLWAINPDPAEQNDGRPTLGATATQTAFSATLWLPLYLYAYTAMARRRRWASRAD